MKRSSRLGILVVLILALLLSACAPKTAPEATQLPQNTENIENNIPQNDADQPSFDDQADLVVVGAGPAGIAAAIEAVDQGCEDVILLEKTGILGGTAILSEGILSGYDTQLSKKHGAVVTAQECYDRMMEISDAQIDPVKTMITAEKCGETIDWLIDVVHVPFVDEVVVNPTYGPLQMIHNVEGKGSGFAEPFAAAIEERPAIRLMLETPAVSLIGDEEDRIIGVEATRDGQPYRIQAKAVILATGGCGSNTELLSRLIPLYDGCVPAAHAGATGDAMLMASEFGAAISNPNLFRATLADVEAIEQKGIRGFAASIGNFLQGGAIIVNTEGERFIDDRPVERVGSFHIPFFEAMHNGAGNYFWAINDQAGMDVKGATRPVGLEYIQADTLEELAALIDVDPVTLRATVDRWNELATMGVDEDFGRTIDLTPLGEGPYYAVKTGVAAMITYAGVLNNEKAEVVKVNGDTIPGLYVAGEAAANANWAGWMMSNAFTWGRIAAQNALDYIGG